MISSAGAWCQHKPIDEHGRRGLLCALIEVDQPATYEACIYIRKVLGPGMEISSWHDDPLRLHADVMDVVAKAAALAELKGA